MGLRRRRSGGEPPAGSTWGVLATVLGLLAGLVADRPLQAELVAGSAWRSPSGMEFVWIPAGRFAIGSPEGEAGRYPDERQHEVTLSQGFWMGRYEVTQGEWEAVMGGNPSEFRACGARCPVEWVSWEDVQEFIRKLNAKEAGSGYEYRLPTEAEWEYAALAGTTAATPEGDLRILGEFNAPALDEIAWYGGNSGLEIHPVGEKRPNAWGLHAMLGGVWEWTADWYGAYPSGAVTDPAGPRTGSRRVDRGGGRRFAATARQASGATTSASAWSGRIDAWHIYPLTLGRAAGDGARLSAQAGAVATEPRRRACAGAAGKPAAPRFGGDRCEGRIDSRAPLPRFRGGRVRGRENSRLNRDGKGDRHENRV